MESPEIIELDDIRNLRVKTDQDYTRQKLKGALLGGYNKKAVEGIVKNLKSAEQQTRSTLGLRISELTEQVDAVKDELEKQRAEAVQAAAEKDRAEAKLREAVGENERLREQASEAQSECSRLQVKFAQYQEQLRDSEERCAQLEPARGLKEEHQALQSQFNEAAAERDALRKGNAVLSLRANELMTRNEELAGQNAELSRQLAELNAAARGFRLETQGGIGEYAEKQNYLINGISGLMQNTLQALDAMKKSLQEYQGGLLKNADDLPH